MSSTKWLWRITGLTGLAATLLLAVGLGYGVYTILYSKGEPLPDEVSQQPAASAAPTTELNDPEKIQILALGDSLTKGYGDEKGEGYVGRVKRELGARTGKPVYLWNFAVNGAVTAGLLTEINKPSAEDSIKQADIILFTIGGNDLNRAANTQLAAQGAAGTAASSAAAASPAPSGEAGTNAAAGTTLPELQFDFKRLADTLPESEKRLEQIIDRLATLNPKAKIVYVGLYHPFLDFDPTRAAAEWIGRWNAAVFAAANKYPNVTVVPSYDVFQAHLNELLYTDHFHPNTAGYDEIAARVLQVLN